MRKKLIALVKRAITDWEHGDVSERIADHLISNGVRLETKRATSEEIKRWIPVTERLPDVGDRCLCNVKSFAFPGSYYISILMYDKCGFVEGCIYTDDVTHWMPLPEPPKEV